MARWCRAPRARPCAWRDARAARAAADGAAIAQVPRGASCWRRRRCDGAALPTRRRQRCCKSPGLAPTRCAHRAAAGRGARARHCASQASSTCSSRALAELKADTRLRAAAARRHRHQRQDHDHGADGACWSSAPASASRRPATSVRRCWTRWPRDARLPPSCPRSGCSSSRASSSTASDGFEPDAATVLNLTQDHLDWHGDMDGLCRRQGARLRRAHASWSSNRDDAGGDAAHAGASRPPKRCRRRRARGRPARRRRRVVALRPRRAAVPRRLRAVVEQAAWPGWRARCRPTRRRARAVAQRRQSRRDRICSA